MAFFYTGVDPSGREVLGTVVADSAEDAQRVLHQRGVDVDAHNLIETELPKPRAGGSELFGRRMCLACGFSGVLALFIYMRSLCPVTMDVMFIGGLTVVLPAGILGVGLTRAPEGFAYRLFAWLGIICAIVVVVCESYMRA